MAGRPARSYADALIGVEDASIIAIRGDGNCLFSAVAVGTGDPELNGRALRAAVVAHERAHAEDFKAFFVPREDVTDGERVNIANFAQHVVVMSRAKGILWRE